MMTHPDLVIICDWPEDPEDITDWHVAKLTEAGDVASFIRDAVQLTRAARAIDITLAPDTESFMAYTARSAAQFNPTETAYHASEAV